MLQKSQEDRILAMDSWIRVARFYGTALVGITSFFLWQTGVLTLRPRPLFLVLLPAYFLLSLLVYIASRKNVFSGLLHLQLFIDLLAITGGIHLAGGIHTPLAFLYVVVISSGAMLLSLGSTVVLGLAAACLYGGLYIGEVSGILQSNTPLAVGHYDLLQIAVFLLLAALIAFQSQFYLARMQSKEQQLHRLKDDFLFRSVHDLRSPSTGIRLVLDKYTRSDWRLKHPEEAEDIELLKEANLRILNLIKDILAVGRGESLETPFKEDTIEAGDIIRAILKEISPMTEKKGIRVSHPEGSLKIVGDTDRFKEVFSNLLDNAVKYNKSNGSIAISYAHEGSMAKITIQDTGIGIAKENLDKLFSPYFRAVDNAAITGTGLGLYIVRKLLEKMGGKIEATSAYGQGTTFTVWLNAA